ncbi:CLUMA_CG018497, isoform A [Clunio marinus]|uniref:CLUMA_CG018497, isoform A n=1 Tax=Clunio marinus TaxID=568069 RepID=A0A1J1J245_9DIPT|nr:CLUMA_CG018497, isoform A [Clunio marinus]
MFKIKKSKNNGKRPSTYRPVSSEFFTSPEETFNIEGQIQAMDEQIKNFSKNSKINQEGHKEFLRHQEYFLESKLENNKVQKKKLEKKSKLSINSAGSSTQ